MTATGEVVKRRTQAERSTNTRDKIVRGAANCIAENGYKAATMQAIAEYAGITWGAIQYHFGNKVAIFKAVNELGAREFRRNMYEIDCSGMDVQQRVNAFLERAGNLLEGQLYYAALVIQRNRKQQQNPSEYRSVEKNLDESWAFLFGDLGIEAHRDAEIRSFAFMVLNGIAMEKVEFNVGRWRPRKHLEMLGEYLVMVLSGGTA